MPDAFVIAILLSLVVMAIALVATPVTPLQLLDAWGGGLWQLLEFASQMCLVLLSGYVLALTPLVKRALDRLARTAGSPRGAIVLTALVSMGLALVNWGLSIVASAFFVRAVCRQRLAVDHRLLCATAYLGLGCMWHAGLSASAPLLVATTGKYTQYFGIIPVTDTLLMPVNVGLVLVTLVVLTALAAAMHPSPQDTIAAPPGAFDEPVVTPEMAVEPTPATRMEESVILGLVCGAAAVAFVVLRLSKLGISALNINTVNLLMLGAGLLLHRTPKAFLAAARESAEGLWPVVLQFPFYAGILGMIDGSGLDEILARGFASATTPSTFPLFVTWYSGLLNYVVPSGGAKLAIEASYIAGASRQLGVPMNITVMAYAWGDMLTDIIQPFWALPLLGAARLGFKDIMGYCVVFFMVYAVIVSVGFGLFAFS